MRLIGSLDDSEVPDFEGIRDRVLDNLVAFVRALRSAGAEVPANAAVVAARAVAQVGLDDRERARTALRAALVTREEDIETFEGLFPTFWQGIEAEDARYTPPEQGAQAPVQGFPVGGNPDDESASTGPTQDQEVDRDSMEATADPGDPGEPPDVDPDEATVTPSVYSPTGRPEPIGVPTATLAGDQLDGPVGALTDAIASLPGRRWTRADGERIDARRALRRSVGTGGAIPSIPTRDRKRTAVKAVLLVDVSQSVLDTIDRGFLIRFLRRVRWEWRDVRVFFFDTDIREVTEELDAPSAAAAVDALESAEAEWGGGTRIGSTIEDLRREHPDAVDRETIVFVISDGLEVGEIERLESGMAWLSGRAGGVLWLNPLAASPDYEPTCRGMAASLPYVDGLFALTGADDITELARQISRYGLGGRIGYEYDPRRRSAVG